MIFFLKFILRRLYLIIFLWYKHFWRIASASIGLFITLVLVFLFLGVARPLKKQLIQKFESSFPAETVKYIPKSLGDYSNPLLMFTQNKDMLYGISQKQLGFIHKWNEIESIQFSQILQKTVLLNAKHPALESLGGSLRFDILVQGISTEMVKSYLFCMKNFKPLIENDPLYNSMPSNKKSIKRIVLPMVIPTTYLDIARLWLSLNGFPAIDLKKAGGFELELLIGSSVLKGSSPDPLKVYGKICGFIPEGIVTTVGVPLNWVSNYHTVSDMPKAAFSYDQVFIKLKNIKDANTVHNKLRKYPLIRAGDIKKYANFTSWLKNLDYIFWIIIIIFLILSSIGLINSFALLTLEKKYEFGLYMVFGSSPFFIAFLMFIEGAIWGCLHSFLALFLAQFIVHYIQTNLTEFIFIQEIVQLQFLISTTERIFLILGGTIFAGFASATPVLFIMYKNTLSLVKKD